MVNRTRRVVCYPRYHVQPIKKSRPRKQTLVRLNHLFDHFPSRVFTYIYNMCIYTHTYTTNQAKIGNISNTYTHKV